MICAGTDLLVYVLKGKVRQSVWCSIKVYGNFTSFLVKKNVKKILAPSKGRKSSLPSADTPAQVCFKCEKKNRCDLSL